MAASRTQIDRVRTLCGGSSLDRTDDQIAEAIERYALADGRHQVPFTWDTSTTPPTQTANVNWIPTYDLNAACADIWEEIAAGYVGDFDFADRDQKFDRSQKHGQAMKQVRHFRSKRVPASLVMTGPSKSDVPDDRPWIFNLPEVDD